MTEAVRAVQGSNQQKRPNPKNNAPARGTALAPAPVPQPTLIIIKHHQSRGYAETQTNDDDFERPPESPTVVKINETTQTYYTLAPYPPSPKVDENTVTSDKRQRKVEGPGVAQIELKTFARGSDAGLVRPSDVHQTGAKNFNKSFYFGSDPLVGIEQAFNDNENAVAGKHLLIDNLEPFFGDEADSESADKSVTNFQMRKVPPGLELLVDVDHFFIQPGSDTDFPAGFPDIKNKFDVVDSHGERIFYAGELWNKFQYSNWCTDSQRIYLKLFDFNSSEILTIKERSRKTQLRYRKKPIGLVEEDLQLCGPSSQFFIRDETGKIVFQLSHEIGNQCTYEFEVFDQQMIKIGRISKTWSGLEVDDPSLPYSFGVSFPIQLGVKKKSLLLTALFVLYFQYVGDRNRDQRIAKCGWCIIVCFCFIFIGIIVGVSYIAAYSFRK